MLCLLTFAATVQDIEGVLVTLDADRRKAILTLLGAMVDCLASFSAAEVDQ